MTCSGCRHHETVHQFGKAWELCRNPLLMTRGQVTFCEVERGFENSCGAKGRFFEGRDSIGIDFSGASISWVQRLGYGTKPR